MSAVKVLQTVHINARTLKAPSSVAVGRDMSWPQMDSLAGLTVVDC